MDIKKISLWGGVVVALILGLLGVTRPPQVVERVEVVKETGELGSVTGPRITSSFLTVNGVTTVYARQKMASGTSTVCSFAAPTAATSTLLSATASFLTSTGTSRIYVEIGKSSSYAATTTALSKMTNIAAGNALELVASSSGATRGGAIDPFVIPPHVATSSNEALNETRRSFVNVKTGLVTHLTTGETFRDFAPNGYCTAVFQLLNADL